MQNKLCTIVGMGKGIGLSVAKKFASEGFSIAMVSRSLENMFLFSSELNHTDIYCFSADAGDFNQLRKTFERIHNQIKPTDVLIYNAAVLQKCYPAALSAEDLTKEFQVNVSGALVSSQQVIPEMENKGEGTILFTGGGFAHDPLPIFASLGVGKAGLWNLCMSLAKEYEPKGIHVATVTVYGKVAPNTAYAPDLIAEQFWKLYSQPQREWKREMHIKED